MHQPLLVGVMKSLRYRRGQFDGFLKGQAGLRDPPAEVNTVDELRDDVARELLGASHVMYRDDVRVVDAGNRASLAQIGFGVGGLGNEMGVRHLDGD